MIYLVEYQLRPKRDPSPIETELKKCPEWAHYLDFSWLVLTNENINQLTSRLFTVMNQQDSVFIARILPGAEWNGWLPQEIWDWLRRNRWR